MDFVPSGLICGCSPIAAVRRLAWHFGGLSDKTDNRNGIFCRHSAHPGSRRDVSFSLHRNTILPEMTAREIVHIDMDGAP
jgi:hypothetical protein